MDLQPHTIDMLKSPKFFCNDSMVFAVSTVSGDETDSLTSGIPGNVNNNKTLWKEEVMV